MTTQSTQMPIFILGMLQRTGTNHLWDLIGLHPDTEVLLPVFEDQLLRWSAHLTAYVDDVSHHWSEEWQVPASERPALLRSIGGGIVEWVASHSDKRVVTKMPSVEQLDSYADLFGNCPLVLLTRDGRSVCESGVKSFGWSYERAFLRWSRAADAVLGLLQSSAQPEQMVLVRYEQLIDDPAAVMRDVCSQVGLDPETYPYADIEGLPVRGSSTVRTEQNAEVHWTPVERSDSFNPRERWRGWTDHTHRRFNHVAGAQQRALGYDTVDVGGTDSLGDRLASRRDLVWDVRRRQIRVRLGRVRRSISRSGPAW